MNSGCGGRSKWNRALGICSKTSMAVGAGSRSQGDSNGRQDEQSRTTRTTIEPKQWFCLFRGDAGPMAVSVESVAEVLETDTLVRLAWSPPQVVGMCSYHREVVPVVVLGPLPPGVGEDLLRGQDPAIATDPAGRRLASMTGAGVLS